MLFNAQSGLAQACKRKAVEHPRGCRHRNRLQVKSHTCQSQGGGQRLVDQAHEQVALQAYPGCHGTQAILHRLQLLHTGTTQTQLSPAKHIAQNTPPPLTCLLCVCTIWLVPWADKPALPVFTSIPLSGMRAQGYTAMLQASLPHRTQHLWTYPTYACWVIHEAAWTLPAWHTIL